MLEWPANFSLGGICHSHICDAWNSRKAFMGHREQWTSSITMNEAVTYLSGRKLSPDSVFIMRNNLHNLFYVQYISQSRMLPFKESNLFLQQIFIEYFLCVRYKTKHRRMKTDVLRGP